MNILFVKEQLEIAKKASHLSETVVIDIKTIDWLIEQAEKVQELRKDTWALNQEIGAYSNIVSDIAKANEMLAKQANRLAKKMLNE